MHDQVKGSMKAAGWGHVQQAVKYDAWATSRRHDSPQQRWASIAGNEWQKRQNASIAAAQRRCCFRKHDRRVQAAAQKGQRCCGPEKVPL